MRYLLVGGGGLLGTGFREALARRGDVPDRLLVDWSDAAAVARHLATALPAALTADRPTTLVWAAGVGSIGATPELLDTENRAVRALRRTLTALPPGRARQVTVLFASSAGALYGGHGDAPVGEGDPPRPVSAYGHAKLEQEQLLREAVAATGCQVVLCRFSNLYGLADGRVTPRGLVAAAVRATRLRTPMTVYVSPDTRRDYVYNVDAAALALRALDAAPSGCSSVLVRDGTTRTVASVLSLVGTVSRRRVPAHWAERPETRLQPSVLRFTPPERGPDAVRRTPMETAVSRMLHAPLAP